MFMHGAPRVDGCVNIRCIDDVYVLTSAYRSGRRFFGRTYSMSLLCHLSHGKCLLPWYAWFPCSGPATLQTLCKGLPGAQEHFVLFLKQIPPKYLTLPARSFSLSVNMLNHAPCQRYISGITPTTDLHPGLRRMNAPSLGQRGNLSSVRRSEGKREHCHLRVLAASAHRCTTCMSKFIRVCW